MNRRITIVLLVMALLGTLPLGAAAKPGDNGGPGNSGAAKQCQQGGWQTLAPVENRTTAFANQDACVSYAAHGGTLVDLVTVGKDCARVQAGDRSFLLTADLRYCDLSYTNLIDDFLLFADLTGANLAGANMTDVHLRRANLTNANLTDANLVSANLSEADLPGANLSGADLTGADLTFANLSGVIWANTICPDGTNSDDVGGTCENNLDIS